MNRESGREEGGVGYLLVRVSTAQNAIPVEGARVTVSVGGNRKGAEDDGVIGVFYTDRSGNTEKITLPAPPKRESESPGFAGEPFDRYDIRVEAEGYYPAEYSGAPVFELVTSIQSVNLIPLAEYTSDPFRTDYYGEAPDSMPTDTEPGGEE